MTARYDLIVIDLDGTLLAPGGGVSDADAAAVELGAGAARCGEELLANGIVDDAVLNPALDLHADRDGETR